MSGNFFHEMSAEIFNNTKVVSNLSPFQQYNNKNNELRKISLFSKREKPSTLKYRTKHNYDLYLFKILKTSYLVQK